ncbi:hypothetical protein DFJ63DRAFT_58043 [Scheffersomyces coipomensis]|uniref:uncharacterized protein n=1 Tax=Scheffersomyces coipomensis TaxID=1788519 RepID=UPI00315CACEC
MADNTEKYPLSIQKLFATKPPLLYIPLEDYSPEKRSTHTITSVSSWKSTIDKYLNEELPQIETNSNLKQQHLESTQKSTNKANNKLSKEKAVKKRKLLQDSFHRQLREWEDPSLSLNNQQHMMKDPYCTIFISRIDYKLTEEDLKSSFNKYGPVESIKIVRDIKSKKSRGYGFVVYERDSDALKCIEDLSKSGLKLDSANRPILVDIERGRLVRFWKPTRLGGGLGGRNYTKPTTANRLYPNASAAASGRRLHIQNNDSNYRPSNGGGSSYTSSHSTSGNYPPPRTSDIPASISHSNSYVPRNSTTTSNSYVPNAVNTPHAYAPTPASSKYGSTSAATSGSSYTPISRSNFNAPSSVSHRAPPTTSSTATSAASKYGNYVSLPKKSEPPAEEQKTVKDKYAKYAKYASASSSTTTTRGSDSSAAKSSDTRSIRSIR